MSKRIEFNKQGEEILTFIESYGVLRRGQIEKFFPDSKKVVSYLIKNQRIHESPDGIYIGIDEVPRPDKCLIAALSVLADLFEKVKNHARATAPVQIAFFTYSGDFYEIVYVGYGMEALVTASFETQLAARERQMSKGSKVHVSSTDYAAYTDITKRLVIVEDKNQMTRLQISGITRFALIQPDGSLSYFKGS